MLTPFQGQVHIWLKEAVVSVRQKRIGFVFTRLGDPWWVAGPYVLAPLLSGSITLPGNRLFPITIPTRSLEGSSHLHSCSDGVGGAVRPPRCFGGNIRNNAVKEVCQAPIWTGVCGDRDFMYTR